MNANVSRLLNEQINKEFYSAYLYLDFANYRYKYNILKVFCFNSLKKFNIF